MVNYLFMLMIFAFFHPFKYELAVKACMQRNAAFIVEFEKTQLN